MTLKENYNVRTHDDIYSMKKEKISEQNTPLFHQYLYNKPGYY